MTYKIRFNIRQIGRIKLLKTPILLNKLSIEKNKEHL